MIRRTLVAILGLALGVAAVACSPGTGPVASQSMDRGAPAQHVDPVADPGADVGSARATASGGSTAAAEPTGSAPVRGAPSDVSASGASEGPSPAAAAPVGPGCADYASAVPTGPGSIDGMAAEPLADAVEHSPVLTSLAAAVGGTVNPQVNLVSSLNSGELTLFAPVDTAFGKIGAPTLDRLRTDPALLTDVLNLHVVSERLTPDAVVGAHPTAMGATLTVTGSTGSLQVDGAKVICGGLRTENATLYLIDTVLTPR